MDNFVNDKATWCRKENCNKGAILVSSLKITTPFFKQN